MTRVGVFHPGTQHSWQTALAFQENCQLIWYATSVFYDPKRWPYRIERWLPNKLATLLSRELRRRHTPLLDARLVRAFGLDEWLEIATRRVGLRRLSHRLNVRGNIHFSTDVIRLIEREPVDVLWGYNSSSLGVFRWAKRHGLKCVLDQTIGHPRALNSLIAGEQKRHPEFFYDMVPPYDEAWIATEDEEIALADVVVVGSPFCYRTMVDNGCPPEKLRIIPYGFDETIFPETPPIRRPLNGRPIEFLFLGAVTARKGIAYLLEAFSRISPEKASLTVVGNLAVPLETFARYSSRIRYIPQLPRTEVVQHLRSADVLIFPSLFEGSALVLQEAIGAGIGIIQSAASGVGVFADGSNGIMLEEVSVDTLVSAVQQVIQNHDIITQWGKASWRLRQEHGWSTYRNRARGLLAS